MTIENGDVCQDSDSVGFVESNQVLYPDSVRVRTHQLWDNTGYHMRLQDCSEVTLLTRCQLFEMVPRWSTVSGRDWWFRSHTR